MSRASVDGSREDSALRAIRRMRVATCGEVAEFIGSSPKAALAALQRLASKGHLTHGSNGWRLTYEPGDRVEILDEATLKAGWKFGRVVEPKRPGPLGPTDIVFVCEGDKEEARCVLPARLLKRA